MARLQLFNTSPAVRALEVQARNGNVAAAKQLGELYYWSPSLKPDYSRAISWFNQAYEMGDTEAAARIGDAYYYSDPTVPRDEKLALQWYERAADRGSLWGAQRTAMLYLKSKDEHYRAMPYLEKAASRGDKAAACGAGQLYLSPAFGGPSKSLEMFKKCGDQSRLAYFYAKGLGGVAEDFNKAAELCQTAAAGGDSEARQALAGIDPGPYNTQHIPVRNAITRWAERVVKDNIAVPKSIDSGVPPTSR
jgi:TPR repeat protein